MLEDRLLVDILARALRNARAFAHLPVAVAEAEQHRTSCFAHIWQSLDILDRLTTLVSRLEGTLETSATHRHCSVDDTRAQLAATAVCRELDVG